MTAPTPLPLKVTINYGDAVWLYRQGTPVPPLLVGQVRLKCVAFSDPAEPGPDLIQTNVMECSDPACRRCPRPSCPAGSVMDPGVAYDILFTLQSIGPTEVVATDTSNGTVRMLVLPNDFTRLYSDAWELVQPISDARYFDLYLVNQPGHELNGKILAIPRQL